MKCFSFLISIIYFSVMPLSHLWSNVFLKNLEKYLLHKFKSFLKDVARGDPWVSSLTKNFLFRTPKYKVIASEKNIKRTFLRSLQGGTSRSSLSWSKILVGRKIRSLLQREDVIYGIVSKETYTSVKRDLH